MYGGQYLIVLALVLKRVTLVSTTSIRRGDPEREAKTLCKVKIKHEKLL